MTRMGTSYLQVLALVTLLCLLLGLRDLVGLIEGLGPREGWPSIRAALYFVRDWLPWIAFVPLIAWMGLRFSIGSRRWFKVAAAHLLIGTAVAFGVIWANQTMVPDLMRWLDLEVKGTFQITINEPEKARATVRRLGVAEKPPGGVVTFRASPIPEPDGEARAPRLSLVRSFVRPRSDYAISAIVNQMFFYLTSIALISGFIYYRESGHREVKAKELQAELVRTQLQMLRMQLNPHFLFNTMNAIATLMRRDVDTAQRMMNRLSDLLRMPGCWLT